MSNPLLGAPIRISTPSGVHAVALSNRPADYAVEWSFVLQHASTIDRFCRNLCRDNRIDAEDLRQEAILWITRLFGSFDPEKSSASTWIYYLCRRARQDLYGRANRRDANEIGVDFSVLVASDAGVSVARAERAATVSQVLSRASAPERAACETVLRGLTDEETHRALGVTSAARDKRIRNLARNLAGPRSSPAN